MALASAQLALSLQVLQEHAMHFHGVFINENALIIKYAYM
jgi:hypothetical protein